MTNKIDASGVQKLDSLEVTGGELTVEEYNESFSPGVFELNRTELTFPLRVEDSGQEYILLSKMKPYTQAEGIELFESMGIKFKFDGREKITTKTGMNEKVRPFFWKHFIALNGLGKLIWAETGKSLTDKEIENYGKGNIDDVKVKVADMADQAEQESYIRNNPAKRIEEATVMQGYGNFNVDIMDAPKTTKLIVGGKNQNIIVGHVFVYNPDTETNQKIQIKIGFKKESEFNFRRYLAATGQSEMHRKSEEWQRVEDYKTILEIGKSEIIFAEGYTINGVPCTEENRRDWVDLFPFWHLQACVGDIYGRGAQLKNA